MYAVERLGSYITRGVYTVSGPFHPFGGAVDIIVVEQPDGSFKSSPWYVRFGKFQGVLKTREKVVNVSVNGVEAKFPMYLNHKGEAYFLREVDDKEEDSMRGDYDSKNFAAFDGIEKSNSRVIGRTSSRRSRLLRLVFGRNSIDEDGVARADSLERAEFAANLLEVKWSTNLSSDPKVLKDNGVSSSALSKLDGNDARNVNISDGEINKSSLLRDNANTGQESDYLDQKPCNGVDLIVENGAVEASMIGKEESEGTREIVYETAGQIDEVIVETTEQIANNSSESYGSRSLIKSDGVDSFDYLEISESSALKGDDSMNTELSIKETIIEYGKDLDSSIRSDSCVQISIVEQISDSIEGVSKTMEEEDSIFTSGSRESFGDRMLEETANSFEEQFLFSDLDVLENTKVHPLDSSFLDCLKEENDKSIIENYNLSIEEPENLIKTTSFPITIPKTNQVDVDRSVGLLPGSWPSTSKAIKSDFNCSLSRSLDSSLQSINCREIEVEASCGTSDGNEEKKSAEQPLNTEDVQVFLSPVVDPSESTLVPGGNWRIWPFYFSRSRSREGVLPIFDDIRNSSVENGLERDDYVDEDTNHFKRKVEKQMVRTFLPTSDQLASLNLVEGRNTIAFTFSTKMLGKQEVDARIYLWKWNTRIVISDVDGTITKSDVLGQFMPMVGMDWSQTGVAHLFTAIKENGYQMLFLSARAISQAYITRQFLFNLKQDGKALPEGPVVISPDGLFPSLYREVIRRAPHEFKIACLENIRELFPADCNPFYAGFGNRDTDEFSYLKVGIPIGKIFIINPKGEITVNRRVDSKSYTSLHDLVHGIFPPIDSTEQEDFNSWNYWKLPTVYLDL